MEQLFKKLFGRKDVPTKDGKDELTEKVDNTRWVKKFVLELSNMEGVPTYILTHQLSIGSEVGNIVVSDPSLSPRHCTFVLQENVVSVMDHGSVTGTLVNGKRIQPGRNIILEETDITMVGDLEVKIHSASEVVEDEVPEVKKVLNLPVKEVDRQESKEKEQVSFLKKFFGKKKQDLKKTQEKKKQENRKANAPFSVQSTHATNSLVRIIAVACDSLIAYSLFIILSPFNEFQAFVAEVPVMLSELLGIDWDGLWSVLIAEQPFLGEILKDLHGLFTGTINIWPFILLFIIIRLLSTLLLGVSISEAALGVRSQGNMIWKRLGGGVRVLLGVITGPFIIFDVPSIVSRRTFKEFMTFTNTYLSSKFLAILGVLLYLPLVITAALLSPLIQGFELPEPILINSKLERRVKLVENKDEAQQVIKVEESSNFLKVRLQYDPNAVSMIPLFKFTEKKKKITYRPSIDFYLKDLQRNVEVELLKTFDLRELIGIGLKGNFFLYDKFPALYNFVYSTESLNPAFKSKNDAKANQKFADQFVDFTKLCFELSSDNAFDIMQTYTPFLKSLMDYRSSFLELIEFKEFSEIQFFKIGNAYFLRISYARQKPFDLILPLIMSEGRLVKAEFDKKEKLNNLKNSFYKFILNESDWLDYKKAPANEELLNSFQVLDYFSSLDLKKQVVTDNKAKALYGYYFERSAEILKKGDTLEMELWKKSLKSIFLIMEKMKENYNKEKSKIPIDANANNSEVPVDDSRLRLFQNFQELKEAFENNNREYFSI